LLGRTVKVAAGEVSVGIPVLVGTSEGVARIMAGMLAVLVGIADGVVVVTRLQAEKIRGMSISIGKTIFLGKTTFFHLVNCKIILPAKKLRYWWIILLSGFNLRREVHSTRSGFERSRFKYSHRELKKALGNSLLEVAF
jgi:hypothetical protein